RNLAAASDATRTGDVLGTPSYMAPEQAAGKANEVGATADVWALGAILYEMLTGGPPFRAATAVETAAQVLSHEPIPPRRLHAAPAPRAAPDLHLGLHGGRPAGHRRPGDGSRPGETVRGPAAGGRLSPALRPGRVQLAGGDFHPARGRPGAGRSRGRRVETGG